MTNNSDLNGGEENTLYSFLKEYERWISVIIGIQSGLWASKNKEIIKDNNLTEDLLKNIARSIADAIYIDINKSTYNFIRWSKIIRSAISKFDIIINNSSIRKRDLKFKIYLEDKDSNYLETLTDEEIYREAVSAILLSKGRNLPEKAKDSLAEKFKKATDEALQMHAADTILDANANSSVELLINLSSPPQTWEEAKEKAPLLIKWLEAKRLAEDAGEYLNIIDHLRNSEGLGKWVLSEKGLPRNLLFRIDNDAYLELHKWSQRKNKNTGQLNQLPSDMHMPTRSQVLDEEVKKVSHLEAQVVRRLANAKSRRDKS